VYTHHPNNSVRSTLTFFQFLAFRQLNKRARVRLSTLPFTLEHISTTVRLLAFANTKGWFAAVAQVSTTPDFGKSSRDVLGIDA
jgi:hypothetical protein